MHETMNRTTMVIVSTLAGFAAALVLCLLYLFFIYQPAQANKTWQMSQPTNSAQTPVHQTAAREIKESDVSSLTLETIYREYFEESSKCTKTYNELFGNADGLSSENSPCSATISLQRNGQASKSVELRRYDKTAKEMRPVEKQAWKGTITDEQFKALANSIVGSEVFQGWRDGTQIYRSNSTISVSHTNGVRRLMSNVDKTTTAFLPLIDAFKNLDRKLSWEKVQ